MTVRVGIRELREHMRGYIERAHNGEIVEVTDRGRAVAMLAPLPADGADVREHLLATGQLIPAKGDIRKVTPLSIPGVSLSETLATMRAEERF